MIGVRELFAFKNANEVFFNMTSVASGLFVLRGEVGAGFAEGFTHSAFPVVVRVVGAARRRANVRRDDVHEFACNVGVFNDVAESIGGLFDAVAKEGEEQEGIDEGFLLGFETTRSTAL